MPEATDATEGKTVEPAVKEPAVDPAAGAVAEPAKPAEPKEPEWVAAVKDEKVKAFAKRFNSPADLAVEAHTLRQKVSNALVPPGKNAKPEEVAEFRRKWGVPLEPTGYKFEPLAGAEPNETFQKAMGEAFHEAGINQTQAVKLNSVYNAFAAEVQRQISENDAADMRASESRLKTKWGGAFDANMAAGKRMLDEFSKTTENKKEDLTNLIVKVGGKDVILGNVPIIQELLAFAGTRLMEGGAHAPMDAEASRSVRKEFNELSALANSDPAKYRSDATQKRLQELAALLPRQRAA